LLTLITTALHSKPNHIILTKPVNSGFQEQEVKPTCGEITGIFADNGRRFLQPGRPSCVARNFCLGWSRNSTGVWVAAGPPLP